MLAPLRFWYAIRAGSSSTRAPVAVLEAVQNGHVDGLATLMILGALWAARRRPAVAGALLAMATLVKLYPALLMAALLLRRGWQRAVAAFAAVIAIGYAPHLLTVGPKVLGYLPGYLREENYAGGKRFLLLDAVGLTGTLAQVAAVGVVLGTAAWVVVRREQLRGGRRDAAPARRAAARRDHRAALVRRAAGRGRRARRRVVVARGRGGGIPAVLPDTREGAAADVARLPGRPARYGTALAVVLVAGLLAARRGGARASGYPRSDERERRPGRRPSQGGRERSLAYDALDGFTRPFKELSPKHLYDTEGSRLFDEICGQPEYYPTRAERSILEAHGAELVAATGAAELVELGSGVPDKTRVLLDAMHAAGTLDRYVPFDVSEALLRASADQLVEEYPGLRVHGILGDFERHLDADPAPARGPRIVAFLGGTIGNLLPGARAASCARSAPAARAGPAAARHRPRQGPGGARGGLQRRRRRHRGVQPQPAARCSTASSTPTSTSAPSSTSRSTTASTSGSRCACAR